MVAPDVLQLLRLTSPSDLAVRRLIAMAIAFQDIRPTETTTTDGRSDPSLLKNEPNTKCAVIPHDLAAISVGLIDGEVYLDLDYILDSNADVDMNVSKQRR